MKRGISDSWGAFRHGERFRYLNGPQRYNNLHRQMLATHHVVDALVQMLKVNRKCKRMWQCCRFNDF